MELSLPLALPREFGIAQFGDQRLTRRLVQIAGGLTGAPSAGLPKAMRTEAALEAAYRFMSNTRVTPEAILRPHVEATCERAAADETVLVLHDTTELGFGGQSRASVGRTNSSAPGFFAHVALAVRPDRRPVGLLGLHSWARTEPASSRRDRKTTAWRSRPDRESDRWRDLMLRVEQQAGGRAALVHVMDREADQYRLLDEIIGVDSRFVIRSKKDRLAGLGDGEFETLDEVVRLAPTLVERQVSLSRRTRKYQNVHNNLPRDERIAVLQVSATRVFLRRGRGATNRAAAPLLDVNVVHAVEVNCPAGEEPVEWVLLTNLPITTATEVETILDHYRCRWVIEELFKAVKTGCSYEKLQLESLPALENALAVVLPIACQMLLLRSLARTDEDEPATTVLTARQLTVLRATPWVKLPRRPTLKDALLAIARLGGHIRNNGEPGWLVLYRGFRDLQLLEAGWALKEAGTLPECDQS